MMDKPPVAVLSKHLSDGESAELSDGESAEQKRLLFLLGAIVGMLRAIGVGKERLILYVEEALLGAEKADKTEVTQALEGLDKALRQ